MLQVLLLNYMMMPKIKRGKTMLCWPRYFRCKKVSENININHKILFYQKKFKSEVIDSFIDSYAAGELNTMCSM